MSPALLLTEPGIFLCISEKSCNQGLTFAPVYPYIGSVIREQYSNQGEPKMKAIDWIRSKALLESEEESVLTAEHASEEYPEGTKYVDRIYRFKGDIPFRMKTEIKKAKLNNSDLVTEQISFGQYRSNDTVCTYSRAEIEITYIPPFPSNQRRP